ncbi:sigma-70 family RNA polymerase sigma factor [uncultured Roseovarius sp.]|uniref:sigma-70 family RNA polymerase sigma factor n=1 Tax=uncultured Roseovarius sp. TaxID=293344 RepID=UPI00260B7D24|nr:sigma-70 family RNA polymerase sigma factor [uncultured Roseovarius sp.]
MSTVDEIETLIGKVSLGDRQAFSRLYDLTHAKLFGVSLRILNNRASAEDVLQETYMKIWRYADRYASKGTSPMTWLITIARNTAIDKLRTRRDSEDIEGMAETLASSGPTPEQVAVASGEAGRIAHCLEQLEEPRDKAVRGAYLEGLSYAELSEKLSVPLNTIRTWLRRSLISLRECMEQ